MTTIEPTAEAIATSRLEAIAAVRYQLSGDPVNYELVIDASEDPRELALAACGYIVGLLVLFTNPDQARALLDRMRADALGLIDNGADQ